MNHAVCIDRNKLIGKLKMELNVVVRHDAHRARGLADALDIVERSYRVTHDEGLCVWTRGGVNEGGMVRYESSCGMVEFFMETVTGMEAKYCIKCGCKIQEEES